MFKKLFTVTLSALLMSFIVGLNTQVMASVLSAQTGIIVQSDSKISEETNKVGDIVKFHVVNTVKDNSGNIILPEGTPVLASITRLEKKKRIGRPAELSITGFSTTLNNGKQIALTGTINEKSKSRMARSIALSAVFLPFFLLMKGAGVELQAGTQKTLYPASDYVF